MTSEVTEKDSKSAFQITNLGNKYIVPSFFKLTVKEFKIFQIKVDNKQVWVEKSLKKIIKEKKAIKSNIIPNNEKFLQN